MPAPHPIYEDDVPKDCCQVRSCNGEGQEYPGQIAPCPYAHPTAKTKGVVKRKPVFGYDSDFTCSLLAGVFEGVGGGADCDRLGGAMRKMWVRLLDECDMTAVPYDQCDDYLNKLLEFCNRITIECTGMTLEDFDATGQVYDVLASAWKHFVRVIWIRDYEWENLVRYVSDPNKEFSVEAEYYLEDPDTMVRYMVADTLSVPLQVWGTLLRSCWEEMNPKKRQPAHPELWQRRKL